MVQAMIDSLKQNKKLLGKRQTIYTRKGEKSKPRRKTIHIPELNIVQKRAIQSIIKNEQELAIFLPLERFRKASKTKVWGISSRRK